MTFATYGLYCSWLCRRGLLEQLVGNAVRERTDSKNLTVGGVDRGVCFGPSTMSQISFLLILEA